MNMDALFEEVGKTIAVTGREAARKAKEVTENVQLRAQLATEKSHLKELYAALGKWYYEKSQGKLAEKEIHPEEELIHGIQSLLVRIAKMEEKLASAEEKQICPACGAKIDKDAVFCSRCGEKTNGTKTNQETPADGEIIPLAESPEERKAVSDDELFEEP